MSARDDYPLGRVDLGSLGVAYTVEPGLWHDLCDELDALRSANPPSPQPPDPDMDPLFCLTCMDEGVFHEERATASGDIADVITGYCPDRNPASGLTGPKP